MVDSPHVAPDRAAEFLRRSSTVDGLGDLLPAVFEATASASADGLVVADAADVVVYWNAAAEEIFGWAADEVLGQFLAPLELRRRDGLPIEATLGRTALIDQAGTVGTILTARRNRGDGDAEGRTKALLARASELVSISDEDGFVTYVSPEVLRLRGAEPDAFVGRRGLEFAHPDDWPAMEQARQRVKDHPHEHPVVIYRSVTGDGAVRWSESTYSNFLDDPLIGGIVNNIRDVTQREEAYRLIEAQEARLSAILSTSTDVAFLFGPDGIIHWVSPAVVDVFGLDPVALIGTSGYDLIVSDDRDRAMAALRGAMGHPRANVTVEFRMMDGSGNVRWVEEVATDLTSDPAVGFVVANVRDVTERKVAHRRLRRLAMFDPLTGLPNRNQMVSRLDDRGARRPDTVRGLVFFDIDGFRDINDILGHTVGDELLSAVAGRVNLAIGSGRLLARCGGDEFGVVCPSLADAGEAAMVADLVHAALSEPFVMGHTELFVTVSAGVALSDDDDSMALIRQADAALWNAKDIGRGRTVVFDDSLHDRSVERISYGNELHRALERHEIVPHFQPVVDLASGTVVAVEALARWTHPERGMVPPDLFIPIAESTGFVSDIGAAVLADACFAGADWLRRGRWVQVAVNASAVELMDTKFADRVASTLSKTGFDPAQLTIEITETAALRDLTSALESLHLLHEMGVQLSLDDFGTGYSSLSFLKKLPVDALKIDRSFVSGMGIRGDDDKIVKAVVGLGLTLGLHVVAEGVETVEQADALRGLGCQFGQGWLWSPAVPADRLIAVADEIEARRAE